MIETNIVFFCKAAYNIIKIDDFQIFKITLVRSEYHLGEIVLGNFCYTCIRKPFTTMSEEQHIYLRHDSEHSYKYLHMFVYSGNNL